MLDRKCDRGEVAHLCVDKDVSPKNFCDEIALSIHLLGKYVVFLPCVSKKINKTQISKCDGLVKVNMCVNNSN